MMGRQTGDQSQLFYLFNLDERIPARHLLRLVAIMTRVLADLRKKLSSRSMRASWRLMPAAIAAQRQADPIDEG